MTLSEVLPPALRDMTPGQLEEVLCRTSPGVFAERRLGFWNAPLHDEWYSLLPSARRLAIVAPREHAKSQCVTVNTTAWRSIYRRGTWTFVFAQTMDQAEGLKERIDLAVEQAAPEQWRNARAVSKRETLYANGSRVTVAGAGKAVRSAHPDVIIGDDVLDEQMSLSSYQREKTSRWWHGTIGNMAHPGTWRMLPGGERVWMTPTQVFLVGTPFHPQDLLMSMKTNPIYRFRRYAAEFRTEDLVDGLAVEVA